MNREDMFELLQDLDDRYITEVDRKKKHGWIKWLSVAAVIVIFIFAGCFILISNLERKNMAGLSGYRLRQ